MTAVDVQLRKRRKDARYADRATQRNAARGEHRRTAVRDFVGVDGEGTTSDGSDGTHSYVLLSVGSESLHNAGLPLTTSDIFQFLWEQHIDAPHRIMVGFYLTYDFTMWLKGLPVDRARMLLTDEGVKRRRRKIGKNPVPFPVYWDDWEFDLHAGKRFKLRPRGSTAPWCYVSDVGPFFQSSFLAAIDPSKWPVPVCTDAEYETIREGKAHRSDAAFDAAMIRYNVLENDVLARVMQTLNTGFTDMDVRLKRTQWYGPGQAAQAWLNNIKAPTKDDAKFGIPEPVLEAARASYYGGWFEIMAHGHIEGVTYEYDINSAYPAVIAALPCFEHGQWVYHHTVTDDAALSLVYCTVKGSNPYIGAAPHRTTKGAILRPHNTRGWYFWHEVQAAKAAGCIDTIEILGVWSWEAGCEHKPFAAIAKLYLQRQQTGKDTPLGRALKLVYNSSYGKLAQSVGEPRYANPLYASLITSGCRVMIWDAIASHPVGPASVTMIATDGVYFTAPHSSLRLSENLGEWSQAEKRNLCQMMPGLYWDDNARGNANGKLRSRGISASDLKSVIPRLDARWRLFRQVQTADPATYKHFRKVFGADRTREWLNRWPGVAVPIAFGLVSAKLALHRNDWESAGSISRKPRVLSGDPSDKRDPTTLYLDGTTLRTRPYGYGPDGLESTPYEKRFGLELAQRIAEDEVITEDGHVDDEIYELMLDR